MLGAIIGDIAGSRYEFTRAPKDADFELFAPKPLCDFTDDTICTIREMAEEVAARFGNGRTQVEVKVDAEAAKRFRKGDLLRLDTSAVRELGWAPKVGLMEMYSDMIEQWKVD